MEPLKLRFANRDVAELPLGVGVHGVGRVNGGAGLGPVDQGAAVRICVDRGGIWLRVSDGVEGVHVNGRQVRRMAMLRVGDAIYLDGHEMRLVGGRAPEVPAAGLRDTAGDEEGDPRVVLRGVGGRYHGRSFTLERPRLVGSSSDADIRIDEPAFADRHARVEMLGSRVLLRDLGSPEGSVVNGEPVRDAFMGPGDQVVFDAHHRFVVEAPGRAPESRNGDSLDSVDGSGADVHGAQEAGSLRRWPWLLLAALVLAALLAALLLFGAG
jgi:hypothetical protein